MAIARYTMQRPPGVKAVLFRATECSNLVRLCFVTRVNGLPGPYAASMRHAATSVEPFQL